MMQNVFIFEVANCDLKKSTIVKSVERTVFDLKPT